jgi:Lrp/AsnC family transcriptional regulator, regulator for asnA, asnC and gidA
MGYELDDLDRKIVQELQRDSRKPFQEIARDLKVSGGTVHVRYNKMKEEGFIRGGRLALDPQKLGYTVCAFIGINLHNARDVNKVIQDLSHLPQIVEAHFTTGSYNLFLKVVEKSIPGLHTFLAENLQIIPEIQSTETLLSLDMVIEREIFLP